MKHILVVDDDTRLRGLLRQFLMDHGYVVTCAASAEEARAKMQVFVYDLMVVDVMMPQESGKEFIARLAKDAPPALMLTALGEQQDRISGLEAGADDYVTKPFDPKELLLRIQNILKRTQNESQPNQSVVFGPFSFDLQTKQLAQNGQPIYLTGSEQLCMEALARQAGDPLTRDHLAQLTASEGRPANERSVDVMINRLRKKIEPESARPRYIQTVRHAGYVLHARRAE